MAIDQLNIGSKDNPLITRPQGVRDFLLSCLALIGVLVALFAGALLKPDQNAGYKLKL